MTSPWQPYREPLRVTLLRTGTIAIAVGAVIARFRGGLPRWPLATPIVLWPSLGGHYVELWFLNWLRPRLPIASSVRIAARLVLWFVAGIALAIGMALTARAHWPAWWLGGIAFADLELLVHLALQLRSRPSFYNGCG